MINKYGLSVNDLKGIFARDKSCVYCHKIMSDHHSITNRADWWTIEYLNQLPPWNNADTVAICCWGCNSSRGKKRIKDWFKTKYCIDRNINENTVSAPVLEYIKNFEK